MQLFTFVAMLAASASAFHALPSVRSAAAPQMAALSRAFTNSGKKVVKAPKKAVGKQRDQPGETLKCAS